MIYKIRTPKNEPYDFTFHIESVGVQTIPYIVDNGINACISLVSKYMECDVELPESVMFQIGDSRFQSIDAVFTNEDHTLGNLLETYIVENFIDGSESPKINYVGYKVPHPLRKEMFVRMDIRNADEIVNNTIVPYDESVLRARQVIANSCKQLLTEFQSLKKEWEQKK